MIGSFTLLLTIFQTMRSDYPLCMAPKAMGEELDARLEEPILSTDPIYV